MKKCSTPRSIKISSITIALFGIFFASTTFAAIPPRTQTSEKSLESMVRSDLVLFRKEKRTDFGELLAKWDRVYGSAATPSLLKIANDPSASNSDRYVAILAHTKMRGPHDAKELITLLDDRDWMVRSAALKSVAILGYEPAAAKILRKLEQDPALVIRLQAIETLLRLRPAGFADSLVKAAMDGKNYRPANFRKGRADWVPQRALAALRELKPTGYARRLLPLLNETGDGRMRAHALHTIETLEAKSLKSGRPFAERAAAWTSTLQASR